MIGLEMHPIGKFIDDYSKSEGISYAEVARRCNVDPSTLTKWMRKNHPKEPELSLLENLARGTNTDLCTLVGLISPDLVRVNAKVQLAAAMITELTEDELSRLDDFLLALRFKRGKERE